MEASTGSEWVEGEVTSLKRAASGHVYFCLKDEREDAVLDCVMYRLQAQRSRRHLSDGARIQLAGRATVWAPRGRLQFVGEAARPAGRGALLEALERLKQRLAAEGLFSPERKRPLPAEPRVVGIVTSLQGAALHDICTVAFRRGSARLVVSPALVQGEGAPQSILAAIDLIERHPELEVLIVGRGGGSSDDLMAFNDERVVRRLARVRVPVVSAVGHEIDVTLADLVADVRAATPSQAAELVIADAVSRAQALRRCRSQLVRAMVARINEDRATVDRLRSRLSDPRFLIADRQQLLDELSGRLERQLGRALSRRRTRLELCHRRLLARHPRAVLAASRGSLSPLREQLRAGMRLALKTSRGRLSEQVAALDSLSPLSVLGRGYAIVSHQDGRAVRSAAEVALGERLRVRLHQGELTATAESSELEQPPIARVAGGRGA